MSLGPGKEVGHPTETKRHEGRRIAMGREISRRESAFHFQMRKDTK